MTTVQTYKDFNFFIATNKIRLGGEGEILSQSTIYYLFSSHSIMDARGRYKNIKIVVIVPKSIGCKEGAVHLRRQRPVILKEIDKEKIRETILTTHPDELQNTTPALCAFSNTRRSFLRGFNEDSPKTPVQLSILLAALNKIVFKEESK